MTYLVDTDVVSELRKRARAAPAVVDWFRRRDADELYISVLTLGELRHGVARIRRRDPDAANALDTWVDRVLERYRDRVLGVDAEIAERWGLLGVPDPVPIIDGLIAATALAHGLVVVSRNAAHFERTGVRYLNPFEPAQDSPPPVR